MIAVHERLQKKTSPNCSPNTATAKTSPPTSPTQHGSVSAASIRSFFLECGLSGTPQQRIANDVLVLEVMKENNTRTLSRNLLDMIGLKIGSHLYHGDSITHETHTVKRLLVQNHAGIEYQPPVEQEVPQDNEVLRDHEEYQSALHEVYEYELAFKRIFTHFQQENKSETSTGRTSPSGVSRRPAVHRHRHVHHHHHHFSRMTEVQYVTFYKAISLTPNLVSAETCHIVFHSQHADTLTFDQFSGTMARLAIGAFSNKPGNKKTQDWLNNKTGLEKVDMLVQFLNRRIAKYQEQEEQLEGYDLLLLKDHTLEHQHNRRALNLNPSMAERFAKDQLEQGHLWLGMEMSSDDDSSSSSSDDDNADEDASTAVGGADDDDDDSTKGRHRQKQERKDRQEKARSKQLNKRKQIVIDEMDPLTQSLIINLMKCVKNMGRDLRTLRQERIMSLILHRWHTWVWHSKFRRMTQQGQAEHQASALANLSHCADEWKRRMTANALHVWYRWSQHEEASHLLALRATRTRVARLYESCFASWRDMVLVEREETRILRNFVMRWNNLELHRWFNNWHRKVAHTVRIKRGLHRMLHAFKFRCFNYWQQHTSEMHNARDMANARGNARHFNSLHAIVHSWRKWTHSSKVERDRVYVMTMRRHHRILRDSIFAWLQSMGKAHAARRSSIARSHWDDMFDMMVGTEESNPVMRAVYLMTTRNNKRMMKKYFDALRRVADQMTEETKHALHIRRIRVFMLRSWRLKELNFVFRGWVHAAHCSANTTRKAEILIARTNVRMLSWYLKLWKNQTDENAHNKHVLHSFILRLKNGSVNKTFNTWKENAQEGVSNRFKLRKFLHVWGNKTQTNCMRAWRSFVKDNVTLRTNLEGIDRYILLERTIAAWRFLTKRRTLHQRTSVLILRRSHQRLLRCVVMFCLFVQQCGYFLTCVCSFVPVFSLIFSSILLKLCILFSLCSYHFIEWSRVVGHLAYSGTRRGLLLSSMRRWCNSVACQKAAKWANLKHRRAQQAWTNGVIAPYQEKIRRLEFELAQVDHGKQSDSKEKHMLHAYLSHSAQRNVFALEVIKQLRNKLT
jgi:hypothetical protein